jgi:hypothetical protein
MTHRRQFDLFARAAAWFVGGHKGCKSLITVLTNFTLSSMSLLKKGLSPVFALISTLSEGLRG